MSEHLPQTNYLDPEVLQKLGDLELVAREAVEGLRVGSHRSPLRGFSTEFAHHRQYAPGDAIRDILARQLWQPVRWTGTIEHLVAAVPGEVDVDGLSRLDRPWQGDHHHRPVVGVAVVGGVVVAGELAEASLRVVLPPFGLAPASGDEDRRRIRGCRSPW